MRLIIRLTIVCLPWWSTVQTITYTLARADVQVESDTDREPERESRRNKPGRDEDDSDSQTIRAQNQVALILICEFNEVDESNTCEDAFDEKEISRLRTRPPPVIIATTHLKVINTYSLVVVLLHLPSLYSLLKVMHSVSYFTSQKSSNTPSNRASRTLDV